jgi:hypothetical protein
MALKRSYSLFYNIIWCFVNIYKSTIFKTWFNHSDNINIELTKLLDFEERSKILIRIYKVKFFIISKN